MRKYLATAPSYFMGYIEPLVLGISCLFQRANTSHLYD